MFVIRYSYSMFHVRYSLFKVKFLVRYSLFKAWILDNFAFRIPNFELN